MTTSNKSAKAITSSSITMNIDNLGTKLPAIKSVSAITQAKTTINQNVESGTRSMSSYFKEFRANHREIESFLKLAHAKGRTFNVQLVHDIIMNGKLAPLTESDAILQNAKKVPAKVWSANRMFQAFILAIETTPSKKTK